MTVQPVKRGGRPKKRLQAEMAVTALNDLTAAQAKVMQLAAVLRLNVHAHSRIMRKVRRVTRAMGDLHVLLWEHATSAARGEHDGRAS